MLQITIHFSLKTYLKKNSAIHKIPPGPFLTYVSVTFALEGTN